MLTANAAEEADDNFPDICRVCRMEGSSERPLFHPCLCTGSIKFVHQDCLTQWLKYSRKEYCELCHHKYMFLPIYHPDMPTRLPVNELTIGIVRNLGKTARFLFHYTLVAVAWLGIVPLTACRINRTLFKGSINSFLSFPLEMISTESVLYDCLQGTIVIGLTLCAFVSMVWLREQIVHGGVPHWLNLDQMVDHEVDQAERNQEDAAQGANNDEVDQNPAAAPGHRRVPEDDNNWQPFEWDRAAEELTWERLFGLDGSLVFLEHVFWVISLNTLFILVFAVFPYQIGHLSASSLNILQYVKLLYFERAVVTLIGYIVLSLSLYLMYYFCIWLRFTRAYKILGLSYLILKVFLLVLFEVGIFPLLCGWWLDVCSLPLFGSSLSDRFRNYHSAPGTSLFLHWLAGMVYVFYFASFILLLREVMRPGVLWFLRNINDPDFNPVQEMIQYPIFRHVRRFLASVLMFGASIMIVVYCPFRIILRFSPSVLPYTMHLNIETTLVELSLELLLLQVILPALLEQSHSRHMLKLFVRFWCVAVGKLLDLTDYLLPNDASQSSEEGGEVRPGNEEPNAAPANENAELDRNLGAAHHALLIGGRAYVGFQPYKKPSFFYLRIFAFLLLLSLSCLVASLFCLTVPVTLGRKVIYFITGQQQYHELYTLACGLYICWLVVRLGIVLSEYLPLGLTTLWNNAVYWTKVCVKCVAAGFGLFGVIAFLLGTLFELIVIVPLRVNYYGSPLFFPLHEWVLGILHCKILCALILIGPECSLKHVFERAYQEGLRNLDLKHFYSELVIPIVMTLGLAISIPYVVVHSILPPLGASLEEEVICQKQIYPSLLFLVLFSAFLYWQINKLRSLLIHIRNERYLVGQRLVNYEYTRTERTNDVC